MAVIGEPGLVGCTGGVQHVPDPGGEVWMQAVVDPLTLAAVGQQARGAQLGQVAGDLGLGLVEGAGEFADTEFLFAGDQQHDTGAGFVGQGFEEGWGCHGARSGGPGTVTYIWVVEYMEWRMYCKPRGGEHWFAGLWGTVTGDEKKAPEGA